MLIAPELFRTLASLAQTRSFTATARALGLRQSTISQHVARLETQTGRHLVDRDTHAVQLTPAGTAVLEFGRRILGANADLGAYLKGAALRGRLRFGACEDFVLSGLPEVLAAFGRRHPEVDIEFSVGLSVNLYDLYDTGRLDIIFVKRRPKDARGALAWREPAVWAGRPGWRAEVGRPMPLVLYPSPSITRALALEALNAARQDWRIAFTSESLVALSAAARAGVGILPHSRRLLPQGLAAVDDPALPGLSEIAFVVIGADQHNPVVDAAAEAILQWSAGRVV